ncbi:MAG: 4-oxalomesaconate tautomerase [Haliea sp.]|uniref:4-oxalomesaconate tautomerase n=1 Tax=Haliea sp. TaxID=1932666 RepID=UPI000C412250|nr:4-oxalomesaconate tautomerase [Haliea sp.]MBM68104.1 4-oxalomesaconate tautomerase [Haliea sp.]|tara:strand:- start:13939 stop:15039 length:1101 start_codon:yes stop_codon:yes gene_type:complete
MQTAIPCSVLRGGTSKGLYFLASDLPPEPATRDAVLLAALGSPDVRQIDGMGGAHPLTSKVAVLSPSGREGIDVEYLFLQVVVDKAEVSDAQNCGNILAGVGPYAIEAGLVPGGDPYTDIVIYMVNTGATAVARVETPGGRVNYAGDARIDGVPGTAAPVPIDFRHIAGSSCGALLPTGNAVDEFDGVEVTCIDNGMPVVVLNAADFGLRGDENPAELEANSTLRERVESIRLQAGRRMNLGDVSAKTVPKMSLVSAPVAGGDINTRTFIPHRVHEAIGVLGSVSVATACVLPGSVAQKLVVGKPADGERRFEVEHPTGFFTVEMDVACCATVATLEVKRAALLRTARLLMRGEVMVPASVWEGGR